MPVEFRGMWNRLLSSFSDQDLEAGSAGTSGSLERKRPDACALNWRTRTLIILEFTRGSDARADFQSRLDSLKTDRYAPLQRKLQSHLTSAWTVQIVCFTVGIRASLNVEIWKHGLTLLGIKIDEHDSVITKVVDATLQALIDVYAARSSALKHVHLS
jgi:hypothetical protein